MTGYALKNAITGKVACYTFHEVKSVVESMRLQQPAWNVLQVVRVRVTEIKPRIKPKRKASK